MELPDFDTLKELAASEPSGWMRFWSSRSTS